MVNPEVSALVRQMRDAELAGPALNMTIVPVEFREENDIERAFRGDEARASTRSQRFGRRGRNLPKTGRHSRDQKRDPHNFDNETICR